MSTVITDQINGRRDGSHIVAVPNGTTLHVPGQVIQTVWRKMDYQASYAANNDNVSRDIDGLNLTITLKKANSLVYCKWWVFYESHHDLTFQAKRGGTVIGYNSEVGDVRYSGIGVGDYGHSFDNSSTPSYGHMMWVDAPGTVGPHTYSIGSRSSTSANYTIFINRATGSVGDNYETGVSWCVLEEIAQ